MMASLNTLTHETIPEEVRGRIFSSLEAVIHLAFLVFIPVPLVVGFSLQAGAVLIGVTCAVAAGFHVSMRRAVSESRLAQPRAGQR